jgi:hypothetical protein
MDPAVERYAGRGADEPVHLRVQRRGCASTISLTRIEYEEVRAYGTHFAIALDHESPDLDLLVSERTGFSIIRKLPGFPARLATASDPRRPKARP